MKEHICAGCAAPFLRAGINTEWTKNPLCEKCAPNRMWKTRFRKYGITKPQFEKMFERQSGLCDLCEDPLPEDISRICVDHCHKQGHNRGLLCPHCNLGLGFLENDKWLATAFRYVERHRI